MDVLFVITTIICAIGWFKRYITCTALIHYMKKKQYKFPNNEEIKECATLIIKNRFRDPVK